MKKTLYWLTMAITMALVAFSSLPVFAQQGGNVATFDHNKTGFILEGAHRVLRCDSCHFQGQFKGTPKDCVQCHRNGGVAPGKTSSHVPTGSTACDACHRTASWNQGTFRHLATQGVMQGACTTCHNGNFVSANARTKPAVHPVTSAQCDSCHTTSAWLPAGYTHANAVPGQCATCHNGIRATGKPADHIPTTASCDACHFAGTTFSTIAYSLDIVHQRMTGPMAAGNCSTCHNGAYIARGAQTKPATHIPTTAQCDTCHRSTSSWATAAFDHSTAVPPAAGRCSACHNSSIALGKPTSHIPTSAQCDTCHSGFTSFRPGRMDHATTTGPIAQGNCATCHNGGYVSVNALTKPTTHIPTTVQCDTCHKGGYVNWAPATMDHTGLAGKCITCHSGGFLSQNAQTKPATHIPTTAQCDTCHNSTTSWATGVFNHAAASPAVAGRCSTCHNGTTALGKSTTHIPTAAQCDSCHRNFTSFRPAQMNHDGLIGQCTTCHNGSYTNANAQTRPITHIPSPGQCDTCHISGYISWMPATMNHIGLAGFCSNCHNGAYLVQNAQAKPATHTPTTAQCDTCHRSTISWATVTFDHATAVPPVANRCSTCHGVTALGKPATHIPTTSQCDVCHTNTAAFAPARMNHAATMPSAVNNCASCHNGAYAAVNAKAKPVTHIPTTLQCDSCHTTTAWLPTSFAHTGVAPGTCATCHNGTSARGKTNTHIPTTASCDVCHRNYVAFAPANMSHSGTTGPVATANCSTCHSGAYVAINAQAKTATHIATTAQCDTCHTNAAATLSWATATFNHATASPPVADRCSTCHNGTTALGKSGTHIPTTSQCDVCHRSGFTAFAPATMNHASTTGPVAARNCATCHSGAYISVNAQIKSATHIPTTQSCDVCHGTTAWTPTTFTHAGVAPGTCTTCHNTTYATGKPTLHIPTTLQCDSCHRMGVAWLPVITPWPHTGVVTGSCATCHISSYPNIEVKPTNHVPTNAACDACHQSTATWLTIRFSHTGIATGTCATCHASTYPGLTVKPGNHIPTTTPTGLPGNECSLCHSSTTSFATERMNHGTIQTSCVTCHDSTSSYLGSMQKINRSNHHNAGTKDCSSSGCHKPLGSKGRPYSTWN